VLSVKKLKRLKFGLLLLLTGTIFEFIHNSLGGGIVVNNYGVSFGLKGTFLIFLSVVFVLFLTYFSFKKEVWGLGLVSIGGWINLIDRVEFGYVRDYWWLGPVYNNIADWIIAIGVGLFLIKILWKKK
jgi:lipoprotein signal peptidase